MSCSWQVPLRGSVSIVQSLTTVQDRACEIQSDHSLGDLHALRDFACPTPAQTTQEERLSTPRRQFCERCLDDGHILLSSDVSFRARADLEIEPLALSVAANHLTVAQPVERQILCRLEQKGAQEPDGTGLVQL